MHKIALWTGRVLSALVVLWMVAMPVLMLATNRDELRKHMVDFGYPGSSAVPINIMVIVFGILYAIPFTSVLGAVLLTAYLGAAASVHIQRSEFNLLPLPIVFAFVLWVALLLREPKLRKVLPLKF